MLRELHISGLGVFDDLSLELHEGLNVLSGETGAGKTLVTTGLSLALGARADASLVRDGARAARVQARFDAPPEGEEWAEDGEVLLARSIFRGGKGSARISGQLATASALGSLGASLVEVHGQHQSQRLLTTETQTKFLDRFAGEAHGADLAAYRLTWRRWRSLAREAEELAAAAREREREADLLEFQVREIESVGPRGGETDRLVAEEARLGHVERLLELAGTTEVALEGDPSLVEAMGGVAAALEDATRLHPGASELSERARALAAELVELGRDVRAYRETLQDDPERLQEVRERLQALRALQRKYGATDEDVLVFLDETSRRLHALAGADDRLAELTAESDELAARLADQTQHVSAGRAGAAPRLAAAIQSELRELGMPAATVQIALPPLDEPGPSGVERAELRLSAGPGQRTAALAKTASGGELSRTMLACRSVLADVDEVPTLVFDEVDAGIGGEAGLAVGRRLARLSEGRQVLVVTHLPQIACFADRHVLVEKREGAATATLLDDVARVRELSRMLAGLSESRGAIAHAEELLAEAAAARVAARP